MKKLFLLLSLMTLSLSAQTTSTALKTQIDNAITNKVGPGSISKANVGNSMKAVVDYVDQKLSELETVATTGNYNDLANLPTPLNYTPENVINKSTNVTTDGASDTKYPSVKSVKTYVDANVSVSVVKMQATNISSSQILNLNNTIVPIVTGEAGKIKTILSYVIVYNYGTTPYTQTGSGTLGFYYGNYGSIGYMVPAFVNATSSGTYQYYNLNSMGQMTYYSGQSTIGLKLTSGNYNAGDGDINIYVTYIETTL